MLYLSAESFGPTSAVGYIGEELAWALFSHKYRKKKRNIL